MGFRVGWVSFGGVLIGYVSTGFVDSGYKDSVYPYFYYLAKYQPISIMTTILKKHKVVVCVTYQVGDDCAHFVHVLLHLSLLLIHLARLLCSCHEAVVRVQT